MKNYRTLIQLGWREIKATKVPRFEIALSVGLVIVLKLVVLLECQNYDLDGNPLRMLAHRSKTFAYRLNWLAFWKLCVVLDSSSLIESHIYPADSEAVHVEISGRFVNDSFANKLKSNWFDLITFDRMIVEGPVTVRGDIEAKFFQLLIDSDCNAVSLKVSNLCNGNLRLLLVFLCWLYFYFP